MSFHVMAFSMRARNSSFSLSVYVGLTGLGFGFAFDWNVSFVCNGVLSFPVLMVLLVNI
ncbi:hypothetical protein J3R30DRAFT_3529134 [Lentinula aciculospora]|uniref:Uncharacterized protein n=1 Tax=Lentinula aciculospora TaxID=153920 RepID=A0A9W9DIT7_9AGAR|nr:hypothetical protein J3R30DRAFT_3529134 [Lentinula aciculospora]